MLLSVVLTEETAWLTEEQRNIEILLQASLCAPSEVEEPNKGPRFR